MLVLSRGTQDKVLFPKLGITVEVLRIANKRVRLGITAPKNVKVVRDELLANLFEEAEGEEKERLEGEILNRVNVANQLLQQAKEQLEQDQIAEAFQSLSMALRSFDELENHTETVEVDEEASGARRALLVDDDDNERELLAGYLRLTGFDVSEADDGLRALYRLSETTSPDVILLDMNMPGMDGQSTLARIRADKKHSNLPVIAVSGSDPEDVGVTVGPGGVDCWYRKPVNPKRLVDQITELISAKGL